ncbi:MAG: hypothetical protein ACJ8KU_05605 [Chthoniobacterales bacterium]
MWAYLLVFFAAFAVDTIPVFAPPAWTLLVLLLVAFHLNPWTVLLVGVTGSCLGRYVLTLYIPKISSRLVNRREEENLRYIGGKLGRAGWKTAVFVFLYTVTPLSTTALFTAAAAARVNLWQILPPFFCGRLITDGAMIYTGKFASENAGSLLQAQLSWKTWLTLLLGLVVIAAFLFVDWRALLEHRQLRLRFRIFK